ncbi:MAG TPA: HEPN domain-containing protein, partial [Chitinophagaceae bacterium]|nr:HEPN domain-containing protein [Chitinophagaceae bacterium]
MDNFPYSNDRMYIDQRVTIHVNGQELPEAGHHTLFQWAQQIKELTGKVPSHAETLKPLIEFLVMTIHPAKIYLLPQSDQDGYFNLLIVISSKYNLPFSKVDPIMELVYALDYKVTCSLHNEGVVRDALKNGHIYFSLSCRPEYLLYDDGQYEYAPTNEDILQKLKKDARQTFVIAYGKAQAFYRSALQLLNEKDERLIPFMLQQSAELTYRAVLKAVFGADNKTHELRVLKKMVRRGSRRLCDIFKNDNPEDMKLLHQLEKAYVDARYQEDYN